MLGGAASWASGRCSAAVSGGRERVSAARLKQRRRREREGGRTHEEVVLELAPVAQLDRLERPGRVVLLRREREPLAEDDLDAEHLEPAHDLVVHLLLVRRHEPVARVHERDVLPRRRRLAWPEVEVRGVGRVVVQVGDVGRELDAEGAAAGDEDLGRALDLGAAALEEGDAVLLGPSGRRETGRELAAESLLRDRERQVEAR